ncbi:MAG: hypothetical protein WCD76_14715 [Pyrinomonadaceae bacterium]
MSGLLPSVGFTYANTIEFTRLYQTAKQEAEIITTSVGTYYRWGVPIPDTDDFEIELWLKESHAGDKQIINAHFIGATEANIELAAALGPREGQHYDGAYRFTYDQLIRMGDSVAESPLVFECPNVDCGENFTLPYKTRVSMCGLAGGFTCYDDEADYLARSKGPPPSYIFSDDLMRDGQACPDPISAITHFTGLVEETAIMTNPVTGCDFTWAVIDTGVLGVLDVVAAPDGLDGFLRENGVVKGTVWLSGRLMEW